MMSRIERKKMRCSIQTMPFTIPPSCMMDIDISPLVRGIGIDSEAAVVEKRRHLILILSAARLYPAGSPFHDCGANAMRI